MNLGHIHLLQKDKTKAIEWYQKSIPLWEDITDFFSDMESDYLDLKMEEKSISKAMYQEILEELKREL